ncbi:MAG: hypothetical protein ICV73_22350 [Acetobacteraceae bacterium]|nr:hypothetical protein [Acetobacteraceae bacterium]
MSDGWRAIATGIGTAMAVLALGALAVSMRGTERRRALRMTAGILIAGLAAGIAVVLAFGRV